MRRESIRFRTDLTFWLAILILLATMLSRHAGKILPANLSLSSGGHSLTEQGEVLQP
jgi:hypothetical protein